jgi:catecholate siderophore receptor
VVHADVHLISGTFGQIGDLNIRNRTMYGDYNRFYQNYVPGAANAAGTLVSISAYNNATRRKNLFSQTDLTYVFETGRLKHRFLGGFELGRQRTGNFRNTGFFNNTATSILVDFNDPTTDVPVTFRQAASDADNRLRLLGFLSARSSRDISICKSSAALGSIISTSVITTIGMARICDASTAWCRLALALL